jgi:ankyrin repeat protein
LLHAGADITAKGVDGETALSLARKRGHTEIVDLLTEAEAQSK